jgi:hypothetical protein
LASSSPSSLWWLSIKSSLTTTIKGFPSCNVSNMLPDPVKNQTIQSYFCRTKDKNKKVTRISFYDALIFYFWILRDLIKLQLPLRSSKSCVPFQFIISNRVFNKQTIQKAFGPFQGCLQLTGFSCLNPLEFN